ncbi:uncharacterized protein LOC129794451 [Lutzomyia longipalpis]|uniref:uncharacterized protein LOC129794451 n=1 Tax=Lutzomyia longipalpis TaxID=7200 RepID=UPI0024837444|nr:uncharacterized protein LOC129794451 [Lutzomyia longipalpis]
MDQQSVDVEEIVVDLPNLGSLRGTQGVTARTRRKFFQFLGVKYAEAPVGELRFKKPVHIAPWTGIKDATEYGAAFPSISNYESIPDEDKFNPELEDCLSLCVYSADLTGKLPVMVYIHGGSFNEGNSTHHPPNYLLEKDIVLVVPQYRLGPIGFMSLMTQEIPGNAGILDILLALEWVHNQIEFFGGDPENVSAFGQSAGAVIISHLTLSPLVNENLFQRVILQSGSSFTPWATHADAVGDARKAAIASGRCTEDSTIEEFEQCLLEMDVKSLYKYSNGLRTRPVLGGPSGVLPETPDEVFLQSLNRKDLSVMLGVTKNDGGFQLMQFFDIIEGTIGFSDTNYNSFKLLHLFLQKTRMIDVSGTLAGFISLNLWEPDVVARGNFSEMLPGFYDTVNTFVIKAPVWKYAKMNASVNPKNTWLYTFDYEGEHTRHGYGEDTSKYPFEGGVAHSDDNIYLFPWPKEVANLNEEDTKFSQTVVDLWTSFATNGVPSSPEIPEWLPMETPIGPYLHLNHPSSVAFDFREEFTVVSKLDKSSELQQSQQITLEDLVLSFPSKLVVFLLRMDWKLAVVLLYHLLAVAEAKPAAAETLTIRVPGMGPIIGSVTQTAWTQSTIYQFLGINYAESPTDELRFKLPVPKAPWTDLRDTTQPPKPCPGLPILLEDPEDIAPDVEDCISLSVYTRNLSVANPVMVYIHGGAFFMGAAYQHPPQYLLEKDIVLVVPQYRLGPFGFLSMKSENLPGNAAIFDVILALKWIQEHIRAFGGDPTRVTLVGQSAGAALVNVLAYSPIVEEHLYQQVILQSGGSMGTWVWDDNPERNTREIAFKAGCNYNSTDAELEDCLIHMDVYRLMFAFSNHVNAGTPNGQNQIGGHRVTIGGPSNFLPANPFDIMSSGGGRRNLRMMAGATKNEGTFSLIGVYDGINSTIGFNNLQFNRFRLIDVVNRFMGISDTTGTLNGFLSKSLWTPSQMNSGEFLDLIDGLVDLCGVSIIKGPVLRAAQGNAFFNPNETWLYSFDYMGEHTRFGYGADTSVYPFEGGVTHSNDNIYLFPWPEDVATLNEEDTQFSMKMVELWTSFVRNGVPSSEGVVEWPPMTNVTGPYLHIDAVSHIGQDYHDEYSVTAREGIPSRLNIV